MSAYGPSTPRQHGPATVLPSTLAALPPSRTAPPVSPSPWLSIHHLTSPTRPVPPALAEYLHTQFEDELRRGNTYSQEGPMGPEAFGAYFLAGDVFVGVVMGGRGADLGADRVSRVHEAAASVMSASETEGERTPLGETPLTLEDAQDNRDWAACVGGVYYVKPNYPGRSSHICNAGFLVPPRFRGMGVATALARSFLFYAPRLGYKASIFNLVYVNNLASVRIWDRLGFLKVGRIPRAGRLRRRVEEKAVGASNVTGELEGQEEEYVDAWVIYKDFETHDGGDIMTIAS